MSSHHRAIVFEGHLTGDVIRRQRFSGTSRWDMEIAFHSRQLRDICESEAMLTKRFGKRVGQQIKRRLADLRAATSVDDLVVGNPRQLPGKPQPTMVLDLCDSFSLSFRPNHVLRGTATGKRDWSEVTRIKIMTIGRESD